MDASLATEAQSQAVTDHMFGVLHRKSIDVDLAYYEDPRYHDTLHRAQLEALIGPIAETWLNHKLEVIQTIFQDSISGETLEKAERIYSDSDQYITDLNRLLANRSADSKKTK